MPDGAEHRGQRPLGERRLRPLPGAPARRRARAAHRRSLPGPRPQPERRRSAIVFASDRTADGLEGAANLFLLDLATGARVTQLTAGDWRDESPTVGAGRPDLLHLRPRRRAQRLLGGYRWATGGGRPPPGAAPSTACRCRTAGLLVGGFHDLSWNLYRYPVDSAARQERFALARPDTAASAVGWASPPATPPAADRQPRALPTQLTLDFAAGDAVVIPGYGGAQGFFFVASDLLGDNLLFGSVGSFQGRRARQHRREHQRQPRST